MKQILIVFLMDESGSMNPLRDISVSQFNEYLDALRKSKEADYTLRLSTFSLKDNAPVVRRKRAARLEEGLALKREDYIPDGLTPLYDAIGEVVLEADEFLGDEHKAGRDYQVLCVILTDGLENASVRQSSSSIRALIEQKKATGYWTFAYLGANQDVWAETGKVGIPNAAGYTATPAGTRAAYTNLTTSTLNYTHSDKTASNTFFQETETKEEDKKA